MKVIFNIMDDKLEEINRIKIDDAVKILENNVFLLRKILASPNASFTPSQKRIVEKISDMDFRMCQSLKEINVP